MLVTCERPPTLRLTAVRESEAPTGIAPNRPGADIRSAKSDESRFGSTEYPPIVPKVRAVMTPDPKLTRKIAAEPKPAPREDQPTAARSARVVPSVCRRRSRCRVLQSRKARKAPRKGRGRQRVRALQKRTILNMAGAAEHDQRQHQRGRPSACASSSTTGRIKPSASMSTPVTRLICPIRIESEMPVKKPIRIGRDRKLARTPSRSTQAAR